MNLFLVSTSWQALEDDETLAWVKSRLLDMLFEGGRIQSLLAWNGEQGQYLPCFIAFDVGRHDVPVGWLLMTPLDAAIGMRTEINVFVDPAYRGKGVGTRLVTEAVRCCPYGPPVMLPGTDDGESWVRHNFPLVEMIERSRAEKLVAVPFCVERGA